MMNRVVIPYIVFAVYKLLFWSWRVRIIEAPEVTDMMRRQETFVIAHWHGDELGILHLLKPYNVSCIISTSKDGEIMNKAVQLLGAETVRGSSTRGGTQALKGIIRLKKRGRRPSVAVDGPKGPIYQVKPGVFQISRLTGLPIVPISFHATRFHRFAKAWNQSRLPLPFAKVTIVWGDPLPSVRKEQDPKDKTLSSQLKEAIDLAKERARLVALDG
jgi:lysophospholipid acyltransferase (LPLAT)-like uncharacterized protein